MFDELNRRDWVRKIAAGGSALAMTSSLARSEDENPEKPSKTPLIISTWPFGKPGNEVALRKLQSGGSTLDAVEAGIRHVESSGNSSVGLSGRPNAAGFVQLDACIMDGPNHRAGAVAGIEGVPHPISAARRVMEATPHVMLVGEGARLFAQQQGLEVQSIRQNRAKLREWKRKVQSEQRRSSNEPGSESNHDTITMLILGEDGTISGGCSTSGLANKLPGRVGDSPIIGAGLYVDNKVGAAGATGIGENVMRYCATFMIVEFMRQGLSPTEACQKMILRIRSYEPDNKNLGINFIALDKTGRYGAAGTAEFPHSVTYPGLSKVMTVQPT